RGTSGLDGTSSWSFLAKKSRKAARMSLVLVWPRLVWLTPAEAASLCLALALVPFALVCFADVIGSLTGDLVFEGTGAIGACLVRPSPKRRLAPSLNIKGFTVPRQT